jgi:hypothetical protein
MINVAFSEQDLQAIACRTGLEIREKKVLALEMLFRLRSFYPGHFPVPGKDKWRLQK